MSLKIKLTWPISALAVCGVVASFKFLNKQCKWGLALKKCCLNCRGCSEVRCKTCDPHEAKNNDLYFACWKKKINAKYFQTNIICEYCEGCIDLEPEKDFSCFMGRRLKDIE